jgi:putative flippase GtrA
VNLGSRVLYDEVLTYSQAIVLAYLTGMLVAFALARRFVFTQATRPTSASFPRFAVVNVVGVAQTWAVSLALARHALPAIGLERFVPEIAHLCGVAVPVFTSFVGHRVWSFRDGEPESSAE